jgi:hypothetical protein
LESTWFPILKRGRKSFFVLFVSLWFKNLEKAISMIAAASCRMDSSSYYR